MKLEVIGMKDMDDGSALMTVDMGRDVLMAMAKIGLLKVITDAANEVVTEESKQIDLTAPTFNTLFKSLASDYNHLTQSIFQRHEQLKQSKSFSSLQLQDLNDDEHWAYCIGKVLEYYRGSDWMTQFPSSK